MKNLRRLRSVLNPRLLPLLIFMALSVSVQAQSFSYTTINGTITITGYTGSNGVVTIPDTINNFPVVSIEAGAFMTNDIVTDITISTNVMSIGDDAFENCYNLTNATIPAGVASIGDFAFSGTSLTSVAIPASATSLGNGVFAGCYSLGAINVDGANTAYSSVNGVLLDKGQTTVIQCPAGKAGSFAIPNGATTIGGAAFDGCAGLTSVTIPNTVTSIGDFAFSDSGLTNVTIPTGLTSIGSHTFAVCQNLTSVTIPNSVTSVGPEAFLYCTSLTNIIIGSGVTSLGSYAFGFCTSLVSAYFNGNAPGADATVFNGDNNLIIYFPAHASGWGQYFATIPTWYPQTQNIGLQAGQFGFNIIGSSNIVFVVEACTNLANPSWSPLQTNALSGGAAYFSDPFWANYPRRFYRLSAP